ncbi:chromobox protein homolog 3-like [Melanaphis sacchari]|uniref:Chromobox 3 n=1 Tax=Melanaphis sacchari TaxID=742174 RepID=A0A2H8TG66_9HEMI|nr:chromobox protein homolog 3-like [Melanaphis sacchari]
MIGERVPITGSEKEYALLLITGCSCLIRNSAVTEKRHTGSLIMDNKAIPKKNGKFCLNGFSVGLTPEKIISMKQLKNSERFFLIQWKETNDTTYVNANIANKYCPQLVINFYEEFSLWKDD